MTDIKSESKSNIKCLDLNGIEEPDGKADESDRFIDKLLFTGKL